MARASGFATYMLVKPSVTCLRHHKAVSRRLIGPDVEWAERMDLLVHIGAHRTGTTAIQSLMQRHGNLLARNGVAFFGPKRTRSGLFGGLIKNPDTLMGHDEALGQRSCGRIAMEMQRLSNSGAQALVVSEENMMGTMAENLASSRFYGQVRPRLARFAPAFKGQAPHVCLAVRSYDIHWASQLAFRIKAGALAPAADEIHALVAQQRTWRDVVVDIAHALPGARVSVWCFEDWSSRPGALIEALLGRAIGLPGQNRAKCANPSAGAAVLANLVQERGDLNGARHLAAHNENGRYMPFTAAQRADMHRNYCDDLAWLSAGAEGFATYLDPIEGTFGGHDMTEGSPHERQEASVAGPR